MASSKERQTSFAAGELSPTLHGRTDLPQFAHGAETLLNWIVTPHGSAVNRPGTIKVDRLSSGNVAFDGAELIPMETSFGPALLAFLWEYGTAGNPERRIFWRVSIYTPNAAGVFTDLNSLGGNVFFISPTLAASVGKGIEDIRVSQIGDVMTIVGFGTTMCELRRVTSTQWTLTEVTFAVEDPPTWAGKAKLEKQYQSTPFGDSAVYKFEGNSSHPAVEWQWAITRIMRDSTGRVYETKKQLVTHEYDKNGADDSLPSEVAVYPDWKQRVVWGSYGALDNNETPPDGSDILVKTRIYRGRDGTFGYLGETEGNFYVDDGSVPDFSNPPPAGENPFEVYEYDEDGDQELVRTETPRVVCHHESRRYVGATPQRGAHVWGSAVDHHKNYDRVLPADEEDALSFELAANKREDIRALISGERLLALTSAAEWLIGGAGENGLLTPLSIAARRISSFGCSKIAPAEAGDTIFFAQARGQTLRALRPGAAAGERTFDASYFAKHMLEGHDIASLAYAEEPFRVVWVVRDDGVLLSMTYVPEQNVLAWTRHEVAGGLVRSVGVVPYGDEDVVFLTVERDSPEVSQFYGLKAGTGVVYLERMASRVFTDIRDAVFVDGGATYDGRNTDTTRLMTVTDHLSNGANIADTVRVVITNEAVVGGHLDKVLQLDNPSGGVPVRLLTTVHNGGGSYDATVMDYVDVPTALLGEATADWFVCAQSIGGLTHLEGETVIALVDGNVVADLVVAAGSVTPPDYFAIAHVGLSYDADFQSLNSPNDKGRTRTVKEVFLELERSRGGSVGADLGGPLVELRTRSVDDSYNVLPMKREEVQISTFTRWGKEGKICFRQSEPLPVTLLGITRVVEYGG